MGSDSDDGKGILRRIPKGLAKFLIFVVALTLSFQATSYFFFTSDAVDNQPRARKLAAGDPIPGTCNGMVKTELGGTILKKVRGTAAAVCFPPPAFALAVPPQISSPHNQQGQAQARGTARLSRPGCVLHRVWRISWTTPQIAAGSARGVYAKPSPRRRTLCRA